MFYKGKCTHISSFPKIFLTEIRIFPEIFSRHIPDSPEIFLVQIRIFPEIFRANFTECICASLAK